MNSFISGAAYYPVFLVLMFPFDFNSAGEGDAQSHALQAYVCSWYNVILPGLFAMQTYAVYRFPLRGAARLTALKERYARVFNPARKVEEQAVDLQPSSDGRSAII